ncbi:chlorophyll a/b-binding protein [Almyronema epifaneia]|uniref:Chlorophyll a/b-binding protein n=1 Tax=Almyronema epifaneia S1 TaxID=2991925 RepID=A0ABW6IB14_9CYAN
MTPESQEFEVQVPDTDPSEADDEPVNQPQPAFGWTAYAEKLNGRFAMIGFISLLLLELITHQDFFTWMGLSR